MLIGGRDCHLLSLQQSLKGFTHFPTLLFFNPQTKAYFTLERGLVEYTGFRLVHVDLSVIRKTTKHPFNILTCGHIIQIRISEYNKLQSV